jgi:hypothetical protein
VILKKAALMTFSFSVHIIRNSNIFSYFNHISIGTQTKIIKKNKKSTKFQKIIKKKRFIHCKLYFIHLNLKI